ncbi:hypothetical protein VTK73DRAFT_8060 [Phialemonium thermophilum]|uniref:Zn(2)-C6 fungal-type domain-containing protein n=1 Tax=Phialemonium thermophilum TaxID=223376 RepID=A0ABR3XQU9_9PEZI
MTSPAPPPSLQAHGQATALGQACDRCHRRKTRCDKRRPECGPCGRARTRCVYSDRAKEPMYRRSFVENLERRINQLEAANKSLTEAAAAAATTPRAETGLASSLEDSRQHSRLVSAEGSHYHHADDVANEVSFMSTSAGGDRQFLGSTSGILLASLVRAGVAIPTKRVDLAPVTAVPTISLSPGLGDAHWGPNDRDIPPEKLARSLIDAYLAHDHLSYPFLHPRAVRVAVDCIYCDANFIKTHAFEAFMFNMILAIATSQVYKFNWQVLPDAETHHQRATTHLNTVLCEGGLRALQAMLLLCQFRLTSSTKDASSSLWHIVGIAARMCFELGLHREAMYRLTKDTNPQDDGELPCLSPRYQENEVLRRCFWSVFALDRVVSITLGRPLAICLEDIDVELPSEDLEEALSPSASNADDQDSSCITPSYRTSLFVHIVKYRDICGRCLTSLHRGSRAVAQSEEELHRIYNNLAAELQSWRLETNSLSLPEMDLLTRLAEARSSFRSKAWYELLYHNGVLLLYRPSASTVSASGDASSLQQVFTAAHQSIMLYAYLLRSRKINFTWITMHSVFMAGLSYVYALSRHFREKRRQGLGSESPRVQLAEEPTIVDIVNSCRACSNVLVAVSERCNAQKDCHEVFDRLSDAVLADAVAVLSGTPADARRTRVVSTRTANQRDPAMYTPTSSSHDVHMAGGLTEQPFAPQDTGYHIQGDNVNANPAEGNDDEGMPLTTGFPLAVDNALRDCFPDLQRMYDAQWGDDAILQLSSDWLGEIDLGNGIMMGEWNTRP